MALKISPAWWTSDDYSRTTPTPPELDPFAGPKGLALVKAWPSGATGKGWGNEEFAHNYDRAKFLARPILAGYDKQLWNFAFVMRSARLVVIDIDGKNGGLESAGAFLGNAPPTLAETSKSGTGYHLYYSTDEEWDEDHGYGLITDQIGVVEGIDIKGVGCVYHHPQQRWNDRPVAPLPEYLRERLLRRAHRKAATAAKIQAVLESADEMEIQLMQVTLEDELAKPMKSGRNNTLFAIGSQMRQAGTEDWDKKIEARGLEVGLDAAEVQKIIDNIERYNK